MRRSSWKGRNGPGRGGGTDLVDGIDTVQLGLRDTRECGEILWKSGKIYYFWGEKRVGEKETLPKEAENCDLTPRKGSKKTFQVQGGAALFSTFSASF